MNDLISREAAIDFKVSQGINERGVLYVPYGEVKKYLEQLPSAQPDLNQWCMNCKEYDNEKHHCPRFNRVIREALKDTEPEIIYCKDCVKHNIGVDDTPYKSYVCPLVKFRGKAQGHEFDYQYCVYGARKI